MSASNVRVTSLGGGRYRVNDGTRQWLAHGVAAGDARWVFFDGGVYLIDAAPPARRKARHSHDETALASPMPATVVMINVQPGQRVAQGDLLIMLEAMKMELPIKAPRDGRVNAVTCRRGELVQPGVPLLDFE
ncbi:MAG TPA: acetyl-CoA carboxylase biotin carboxyl carrier protein subunit [Vicinamibacterales bacterium]